MMIESVAVVAAVAAAAVTLVSNATASLMHGQQSASDSGPVGEDDSAAIAMQ
jgi:hypothetical protein